FARGNAGRRLRNGSGAHRRIRALLLVHRRDRDVPRGRGDRASDRRGRRRRARARAARRDGRSGRPAGGCRGRLTSGSSLRGAGLRHLPACGAMRATLYTDGGARGNPGPAAYAYVLEADDGTVLDSRGETIGVATNNVAEYRALVAGLARAAEAGVSELEVVSDSELLVRQMTGVYRVKNRALQTLFLEASELARTVGKVSYRAVRREQNELADMLVNEALDAAS